jgi:hypothetical protein
MFASCYLRTDRHDRANSSIFFAMFSCERGQNDLDVQYFLY